MSDHDASTDGPESAPATADLVDRYGDKLSSIALPWRRFGRRARFFGPAVTVTCREDNALLKATLSDHPRPSGRVLVVDGGGSVRCALVGDVIAGIAVRRGWAGLVIHGAVRDSVALGTLDLGVAALGTNPAKSAKTGAGRVGVDVEIGGVVIAPDDKVYVDEDGIVVLPSRLVGD